VTIGDALAEGRRQAGMSVSQVSQRTCIRETIIRGIERDDFSACGGDFYVRGHIRSIAGAVGIAPEPLVRDYDAQVGAPQVVTAADVFQPVTPVKLKERRRPNWSAAMAVVLVLVVGGYLAFHYFARSSAGTPVKQDARVHQSGHGTRPRPSASPAAHGPRLLHIKLTATQDSWIELRTAVGVTIFSGMVYAGTSMNWTERHAVVMTIGNPAVVRLIVNGKSKIPAGSVSALTLSLRPGRA